MLAPEKSGVLSAQWVLPGRAELRVTLPVSLACWVLWAHAPVMGCVAGKLGLRTGGAISVKDIFLLLEESRPLCCPYIWFFQYVPQGQM